MLGIENKWRNLIFLSKILVAAQGVFLAVGVLLLYLGGKPVPYFNMWFTISMILSFIMMILLLVKKPYDYGLYVLLVLLFPPIAGILSIMAFLFILYTI